MACRSAVLSLSFTLSFVSMLACDSGPGPLPAAINCTGSAPGEACATDGDWCATTNQCGVDVSYCKCTGGTYDCTDPYTAAEIQSCTVVAQASCSLEGTGVCDFEPVGGGSCGCGTGAWSCTSSCAGCPSSRPADGSACTTSNVCRYGAAPAGECTCAGGTFTCRDT